MNNIKILREKIFENKFALKTMSLNEQEKKELIIQNDFYKHEIANLLLKRSGIID